MKLPVTSAEKILSPATKVVVSAQPAARENRNITQSLPIDFVIFVQADFYGD